MEFTHFFFLSLLFGIGCAWPWHHKITSMERARNMQTDIGISDTTTVHDDLCGTVAIDPIGPSKDTAVHILSNPSGTEVCYLSKLASCCEVNGNSNQIGSASVTVGSGKKSVEVRYYTIGGYGQQPPLDACAFIRDSSVAQCCQSGCVESTSICQENVISCDPATGCVCKEGFIDTEDGMCCQCDLQGNEQGIRYYRDGDQCKQICDSCGPRDSDGRCRSCRNGFQPPDCCKCPPGSVIEDGICKPACVNNTVEGTTCTETSCTCIEGFEPPTCCNCIFGGQLTDFFEFNGECKQICTANADQEDCNSMTGCSRCADNFEPPDCCQCVGGREIELNFIEGVQTRICVCPRDSTDDGGSCTPCPPDKEVVDNQCVCKENTVGDRKGGCKSPCSKNCVSGFFDSRTGCSQCKTGFEVTPFCCDCENGYIEDGDECIKVCRDNVDPSVELGCSKTSCNCKEGFAGPTCCNCIFGEDKAYFKNIEECKPICLANAVNFAQDCNVSTGCSRCADDFIPPDCCQCPSGKEIVNGKCECDSGTEDDGNGGCRVFCVDEQDLVFVVDPSSSFNVLNLRRIVRTLQLVIREASSEAVRIAVVSYPLFLGSGNTEFEEDARYLVSLTDNCSVATNSLNNFTLKFDTPFGRSTLTQSYEALDLVANGVRARRKTSVLTITDSNSEGYENVDTSSPNYVPNKIAASIAVAKERASPANALFLAIGVNTLKATSEANYLAELAALSENVTGQMTRTEDTITATSNAIIKLLEDNGILCAEQVNKLKAALAADLSGDSSLYATCIKKTATKYGISPKSLEIAATKCGSVCKAAPGMLSKLEEQILQAVEQVLMGRKN